MNRPAVLPQFVSGAVVDVATGPARRATLLVASLGTFVALVTYTGPLGNLPTVARALGAGTTGQTWILSSISVALAASLLTLGALADDHGRRRVFVLGCVVLAVGSILCSVAGTTALFIAGRLVEGVGGAGILASSLGLAASVSSTPAQRAAASAAWGASVGAGIAVGPIVTGLLDEAHIWRAFYVLLAIASLLLASATLRLVAESAAAVPRPVDAPGALALGGALVLTLVALTEAHHGLTGVVESAGALAIVLWIAFVAIEWRREHPMLDLKLFSRRPFVAATVAALGTGVSIIGLMSFACSFLIGALGLSTLGAALVLFVWSGTSAIAAALSRRLPAALHGSRQLVVGLFGAALGNIAMLGVEPGEVWRLVPGLLIAGVASGVLNAGLGREAVVSVPAERASLGSGANNTARYLGSAIGITVVVLIATASGSGQRAAIAGWNHALVSSAVIAALTAIVVLAVSRQRRPAS